MSTSPTESGLSLEHASRLNVAALARGDVDVEESCAEDALLAVFVGARGLRAPEADEVLRRDCELFARVASGSTRPPPSPCTRSTTRESRKTRPRSRTLWGPLGRLALPTCTHPNPKRSGPTA